MKYNKKCRRLPRLYIVYLIRFSGISAKSGSHEISFISSLGGSRIYLGNCVMDLYSTKLSHCFKRPDLTRGLLKMKIECVGILDRDTTVSRIL